MYGRVLKVLGSLNFQVYGNDGRTRICKVCGAMRKRVWVNVGDLVIISVREFEVSAKVKAADRVKEADRGDIIYKFDQSLLAKAKKLDGINPNLFAQLETADSKVLNNISERAADGDDGELFEFDDGGEQKRDEDESGSDEEEGGVAAKVTGKVKPKAKESKHASGGGGGADKDDDFDIDDI